MGRMTCSLSSCDLRYVRRTVASCRRLKSQTSDILATAEFAESWLADYAVRW